LSSLYAVRAKNYCAITGQCAILQRELSRSIHASKEEGMGLARIWTEIDIKDIENHIVVVDDIYGFCPGCREMGIKLENLKKCPKCGHEFKYVTARDARGKRGIEMAARVKRKLPELTFIDYDDYERLTGKDKAAGLFKDI